MTPEKLEDLRRQEETELNVRFANLQNALYEGSRDPTWTESVASQLEESIAANQAADVAVRDVMCVESLCRVQFEIDGDLAQQQAMGVLRALNVEGGTYRLEPDDPGKMTVFVSKLGSRLPM